MEPSEIGLANPGRIPMSDVEHAAVDKLQNLKKNTGKNMSLTRDEEGHLIVTTADGKEIAHDENGKVI